MLKVRLIPSLLLSNGRCVKGVRFGEYRDVGHPVTNAKIYDAQGADELLFLDISASQEGRDTLYDIVADTAEQCFMPLTVGGGVRTVENIRRLLRAGADKVAINTAAVTSPELITEGARLFGTSNIVVSIDYRRDGDGRCEVFTHGGRQLTGIDPVSWAQRVEELGAGEILLTSIDRDGTREGYDLETIRTVADSVSVPVIAAGGVGSLEHLVEGVTQGHAAAVAAGSIFHFTDQSVIKARYHMRVSNLDVRIV